MKDYDEDWVRASIVYFSPQKISNLFCTHKYSENLLREVWDYFNLNSKFWMRNYHFSKEFLREMKDKMHEEYWNEIILIGDVYTNKEKEELVKEFNLPYTFGGSQWWLEEIFTY